MKPQTTNPEHQTYQARIASARADPTLADPFRNQPINIGTRADYRALARFHYRQDPPATFEQILTIKHPKHNATIAVLVISRPTLNAAWRNQAWPARYNTRNKAQDAKRINDELRTISRVIIDPRYRSLGLATKLIKHYLNNPLTPHTEAVAAMGTYCPFFQNAGMTPCHPTQPTPNTRLADALVHLAIPQGSLAQHIHSLTNNSTTADSLTPTTPTTSLSPQQTLRFLGRELRIWAKARPSHRHLAAADIHTLAKRADAELLTKIAAYAHASSTPPHPQSPLPSQHLSKTQRSTPTQTPRTRTTKHQT